jgi:hypothetical protein
MISTSHQLIKKESIVELTAHRERAIELYRRAAELMVEANKTAKLAFPSQSHGGIGRNDADFIAGASNPDCIDKFVKIATTKMDQSIWRHLVLSTGLGELMDNQARKDFHKANDSSPAPATLDNVCATFFTKSAEAPEIFNRGLVNAFSHLAPGYKTNSAFKIGPKVIMDRAFDCMTWRGEGGVMHKSLRWNHGMRAEDELADVERVLRLLDGKAPVETRYGGIIGVIDAAVQEKKRTAEDEYFSIKWFEKGSMHITFKRLDLIAKANQIIAKHFGEVIPDEDSRHRYSGTRKRPSRKAA